MITILLVLAVSLISTSFTSYIEVNTDNGWNYVYHPLNGSILNFRVKAENDAHVMLTHRRLPNGRSRSYPGLEVVIGGWHNLRSAIRKRPENDLKMEAQTPNILSGEEFRGFWIKLVGAGIMVGKEHESVPFLTWTDPNHVSISYFGFATAFESTGKWKVDAVKGVDFDVLESRCSPGDVIDVTSPWDQSILHVVKDACYSALTQHSCKTVDEPDHSSEMPPSFPEQAVAANNDSVADTFNKKRYIILTDELKTWDEAKTACEEQGQRFASINNEEEEKAFEEAFKEQKDEFTEIWIAANDRQKEGEFVWYDGSNSSLMTFNNWQRGKVPSRTPGRGENCVYASALAYVIKNKAYWFTANCEKISHFACEVDV